MKTELKLGYCPIGKFVFSHQDALKQKRAQKNRDDYLKELQETKKEVSFSGFKDDEPLLNLFAMRDVMLELAKKEGLTVYAVQSFMSICKSLGCMVEYALAMVSDKGIPVACETDIHGAISSVILQAAALDEEMVFLADLTIRHPDNDNAVLLWHSSSPLSLKDKKSKAKIGEHWILPGIPSGSCHWQLKSGNITILRFDADRGEYRMIIGEGKIIPGPYTQNVYCWMQVNDWEKWERKFIEGPYIHHVACNFGKYLPVICEAVKYLPGIKLDLIEK